jgi:predicted transcriptional regulator
MQFEAEKSIMKENGNDLLHILEALSNPYRLRIIALLKDRRKYVSELAREIGISRPLLYLHLQRLEGAGLVSGSLELSDDGKAMKFYELTDFNIQLSPETIAKAVSTLSTKASQKDDDE